MATVLTERVAELRAERRHGGSWMARRAVEALAELAGEPAERATSCWNGSTRRAASWRPAGARWAVSPARSGACSRRRTRRPPPPEELRRLVRRRRRPRRRRDRAAAAIAIQLAPSLTDAFVLTHSALGDRARGASCTRRPEHVFCTVSAPFEEGRAFAEDLAPPGSTSSSSTTRTPIKHSPRLALLLGADTVFRDGAVCNKVGTLPLAEAATRLGVRRRRVRGDQARTDRRTGANRRRALRRHPAGARRRDRDRGRRLLERRRADAHRPHAVPARRLGAPTRRALAPRPRMRRAAARRAGSAARGRRRRARRPRRSRSPGRARR